MLLWHLHYSTLYMEFHLNKPIEHVGMLKSVKALTKIWEDEQIRGMHCMQSWFYTVLLSPSPSLPHWISYSNLFFFCIFILCTLGPNVLSFAYITYCLVVCRWQNGQGCLFFFSSPSVYSMSNVSPLQQRFKAKILSTNLSSVLKLVLKYTFT